MVQEKHASVMCSCSATQRKLKKTKVLNTGHTQKNGAVSKVDKKFISYPTWAQHTLSAAKTVQVSDALPAVCFSCLL
jgi:hypothetical protein